MVHKSDLSWTVKVNNPADLYHKGDDVEAIILSINHDEKKVSLGIKQLWDDPWPTLFDRYPPGTVVEGVTVLALAEYGAFVRIAEGIEAIVPTSEMPDGVQLKPAMQARAEVANVDSVERRITMSMRNVGETAQAEQLMALNREKEGKSATLGDLLKEKLGDKLQAITSRAEAAGREKDESGD